MSSFIKMEKYFLRYEAVLQRKLKIGEFFERELVGDINVQWFTSHSFMNLFTSSGDALLCLLNSSFTYWSPRALKSIGRKRCRTRILLYNERTLEI